MAKIEFGVKPDIFKITLRCEGSIVFLANVVKCMKKFWFHKYSKKSVIFV